MVRQRIPRLPAKNEARAPGVTLNSASLKKPGPDRRVSSGQCSGKKKGSLFPAGYGPGPPQNTDRPRPDKLFHAELPEERFKSFDLFCIADHLQND